MEIVKFNETVNLIPANVDTFIKHYPEEEELLRKYENNPGCSCKNDIFKIMMNDLEKYSVVITEIREIETKVIIQKQLDHAIVMEFDTLEEANLKLKDMADNGIILRGIATDYGTNNKYIISVL